MTKYRPQKGVHPGAKYGSKPITPQRKATFLKVLSETGSMQAAARAASPHSRSRQPGYSTFLQLLKTNPEFAEQVENAKQIAQGRLEQEMIRRAHDGVRRPIVSNGEIVAYEQCFSDNLLIFALKSLDPQKYREKSQLEITGNVNVTGLMLRPQDLLALNAEQRQQLEHILTRIAEYREEPIDAEYSDITPALPAPPTEQQ